jgi:dihydrofolate synthase/folylpolyglutamate synthase
MLGDKDIAGVVSAMSSCIDHWYLGVLEGDRVASAEQLTEAVRDYSSAAFDVCDSASQAWRAATRAAGPGDRVVVFGSFRTVAQVVRETL